MFLAIKKIETYSFVVYNSSLLGWMEEIFYLVMKSNAILLSFK